MPQGERGRRATIHDVARRAGVSAATVSKVLRGNTTVQAENVARVQDAVRGLGYRVDPLAAGLRHEQRRIIGAIVPDLESSFFGALVTGLERAAEAAGYDMIVASSRENEAREAELATRMNDWRVAGTVLVPVRSERGLGAAMLRELGTHAVLVDRVAADDHFDTVTADNEEAAAAVADFLVARGHTHMLLHAATHVSKAVRLRVEGFTARAAARAPRARIDTLISDGDRPTQQRAIRDYFDARDRRDWPTAVFSLSQHSTLLVLSELRRRELRIPGEIALVGFDDADWMQTTWPSITAVAQPVTAIAIRALETLLERVDAADARAPVHHLEACMLRVRQSCGPAGAVADGYGLTA